MKQCATVIHDGTVTCHVTMTHQVTATHHVRVRHYVTVTCHIAVEHCVTVTHRATVTPHSSRILCDSYTTPKQRSKDAELTKVRLKTTFSAQIATTMIWLIWSLTHLPTFEPDTRMKTDIVQEAGIDKGQCQIRHATQLDQAVDLNPQTIIIVISRMSHRPSHHLTTSLLLHPVSILWQQNHQHI